MQAAVTYARVSTAQQATEGYPLAEQQARLKAHCSSRGYRLVEHIADEGISGRLAERPGLARLISLAESGAAQRVVGPLPNLLPLIFRDVAQHPEQHVAFVGLFDRVLDELDGDAPLAQLIEGLVKNPRLPSHPR